MGRKVERMPAQLIPLFQSVLLFSQSDRLCIGDVEKLLTGRKLSVSWYTIRPFIIVSKLYVDGSCNRYCKNIL